MTATTETAMAACCPESCALPAGHPYINPYPDNWERMRFHVSGGGASVVEVSQAENVVNGVLELGTLDLTIWTPENSTTAIPP